jgi:hypothetical protein
MYFSLAVVKAAASHFEARYDVPTAAAWSAGVVYAYEDDQNYAAVVVSQDGKLRSFVSTAGSALWGDAGSAPASLGDGTGSLAVDMGAAGMVTVTVNGQGRSLPLLGLAPRVGLAINDSRVSFHDVGWK